MVNSARILLELCIVKLATDQTVAYPSEAKEKATDSVISQCKENGEL